MAEVNRAARRKATRGRSKRIIGASVLALGGLTAGYMQSLRLPTAYASGSCTVTVGTDNGTRAAGTLSGCLNAAASASGSYTITLATDVALTAHSPYIDLEPANLSALTISGSGHTISGGGLYRGIDLDLATNQDLIITDVTMTDLVAPSGSGTRENGAALLINTGSGAEVILQGVQMIDNTAFWGGGVYLYAGASLSVTDSSFIGNAAIANSGDGGALGVVNGAIAITNSSFSANTARDDGGAVFAGSGAVTVQDSVFVGNTTTRDSGSFGGAIKMANALDVSGSIFQGNSSPASGGAIYDDIGSGNVTIVDSSFTSNSSVNDGGAIWLDSPDVTTLSGISSQGNYSADAGGALYITDMDTSFSLSNSTFRDDTAAGFGGAIHLHGLTGPSATYIQASILDTTFEGGSANQGGAVYVGGSNYAAEFVDSTFSDNAAVSQGEAVFAKSPTRFVNTTLVDGGTSQRDLIRQAAKSTTLLFTTVASDDTAVTVQAAAPAQLTAVGSVLQAGAVGCAVTSGVTDDTFAFATDASCGFSGTGSDDTFVAGDFALGALQDNGGLTDTMLPGSGSVLVSGGAPNGLGTGVIADQRGAVRAAPFTIGAVQAGGSPAPGGSNAPAAAAGDASAVVTAPTTTAGGAPTSWVMQAFTVDDTYLIPTDDTCAIGSASGSCTVTGLTNGQPYKFKATPSSAQGVGRVSLASNAVTPRAPNPNPPSPAPVFPPSAPHDVTAVGGDASAMVSWREPASAGSFPVSTYKATSTPGGRTCLVSATVTSCDVTGLTNGTTYTFTVEALNGAGWSPAGGPSNRVVPGGVTPAPSPAPLPGPLRPGDSVLQTNGVEDPNVKVDPNQQDNGLQIKGDGWNMDLDGLGPDGKPLNLSPEGSLRLANERDVATEGSGFLPNSEVDLYVDPPVLLTGAMARTGARSAEAVYVGTVKTDGRGSFTGTATLPADITPGDHVLQAVGYSPARQSRAMSLGVIVEPWIVLDQGTRKADGMHDRIRTTGTSGGIDAGVKLTPWIRYIGQGSFKQGVASITVQSDGRFRWTREIKKSKGLTAYVSYVDVESNRVFWVRVR